METPQRSQHSVRITLEKGLTVLPSNCKAEGSVNEDCVTSELRLLVKTALTEGIASRPVW